MMIILQKKYQLSKNNFLKQNHNKLNFIISYSAIKCFNYESDKIIKSFK